VAEHLRNFYHPSEAGHRERSTPRATHSLFNLEGLEAVLFASSCLLPSQYYDQVRRRRVLEGEEALMFAVLEDAIRLYLRCVTPRNFNERQEVSELERWFEGRNQSGIFAFESLCETLGIEPRILRKSLRWMRNRLRAQGARYKALPGLRRPPVRPASN
jgi:hypothetical protein